MQTWRTTANDTLTPIGAQLKQKNAAGVLTVVDLTAKTVKFKMIDDAGATVIAETATGVTVTDATNGKVQFDFSAAQVATIGTYWGWFVVYSGGECTTFPVGRQLAILIFADE